MSYNTDIQQHEDMHVFVHYYCRYCYGPRRPASAARTALEYLTPGAGARATGDAPRASTVSSGPTAHLQADRDLVELLEPAETSDGGHGVLRHRPGGRRRRQATREELLAAGQVEAVQRGRRQADLTQRVAAHAQQGCAGQGGGRSAGHTGRHRAGHRVRAVAVCGERWQSGRDQHQLTVAPASRRPAARQRLRQHHLLRLRLLALHLEQ